MSGYQVYIKYPGQHWLPVSRVFERENQAQDWALDIDTPIDREIRRSWPENLWNSRLISDG